MAATAKEIAYFKANIEKVKAETSAIKTNEKLASKQLPKESAKEAVWETIFDKFQEANKNTGKIKKQTPWRKDYQPWWENEKYQKRFGLGKGPN